MIKLVRKLLLHRYQKKVIYALTCSSSLKKRTPFLPHYNLKDALGSLSQGSKTMACHLQ